MGRFARVVRRAEERLGAPEPARSRILLELAQDLDDLYRSYRALGLSEAEAMRRAERLLGASDEVVADLTELHRPAYARWLARFPVRGGTLEASLAAAVVVVGLAAAVAGLWSAGFEWRGPWMWALLPVVGVGLWLLARSVVDSVLGGPGLARSPAWHTGVPGVAACAVVIGLLGALVEVNRGLSAASAGGGDGWIAAAWLPVVAAVRRAADVLSVSLSLALFLLLVWFPLAARWARIAAIREAALDIAAGEDGQS